MTRAVHNLARAFTLLEMMAAMAVLAVLMVLVLNVTGATARIWQGTRAKMDSFEQARAAFDRITTTLSQADLNIYWGYDNTESPTKYQRNSELQFLSGNMAALGHDAATYPTHGLFFQAPTGKVADKDKWGNLPTLLNAFGYFVEFGDDADERPGFLPQSAQSLRYRYRLKEWQVPSDRLKLYEHTSGKDGPSPRRNTYLGPGSYGWIDLSDPVPHTLAENVIALIVSPRRSLVGGSANQMLLTSDYLYNSRNADTDSVQFHQLPPLVEVVMVAVEEESVQRMLGNPSSPPNLVPAGLFDHPEDLEADLATLTRSLTDRGIRHVVLRSVVRIVGAKGKT
jgi:uncharacterized protein (TIGR02599 family)